MTEPVDTDALRCVTRNEGLFESEASLVSAAADEVDGLREANEEAEAARSAAAAYGDRLRVVIENAPHDSDCNYGTCMNYDELYPCTCWKADAL